MTLFTRGEIIDYRTRGGKHRLLNDILDEIEARGMVDDSDDEIELSEIGDEEEGIIHEDPFEDYRDEEL